MINSKSKTISADTLPQEISLEDLQRRQSKSPQEKLESVMGTPASKTGTEELAENEVPYTNIILKGQALKDEVIEDPSLYTVVPTSIEDPTQYYLIKKIKR